MDKVLYSVQTGETCNESTGREAQLRLAGPTRSNQYQQSAVVSALWTRTTSSTRRRAPLAVGCHWCWCCLRPLGGGPRRQFTSLLPTLVLLFAGSIVPIRSLLDCQAAGNAAAPAWQRLHLEPPAYKYYTWYIPGIYHGMDIPRACIYHVYTLDIEIQFSWICLYSNAVNPCHDWEQSGVEARTV